MSAVLGTQLYEDVEVVGLGHVEVVGLGRGLDVEIRPIVLEGARYNGGGYVVQEPDSIVGCEVRVFRGDTILVEGDFLTIKMWSPNEESPCRIELGNPRE